MEIVVSAPMSSTIALNVLAMNLEKLVELLFVFIAALTRLLLANDRGQRIRTMPQNPLIVVARGLGCVLNQAPFLSMLSPDALSRDALFILNQPILTH